MYVIVKVVGHTGTFDEIVAVYDGENPDYWANEKAKELTEKDAKESQEESRDRFEFEAVYVEEWKVIK